MKKSIIITFIILLAALTVPQNSAAETIENKTTSISVEIEKGSDQAAILLSRLNELNNMDKRGLDSREKREMRKEVRSIEKQLRDLNGGVYLSVGAVIIILLLLILLL